MATGHRDQRGPDNWQCTETGQSEAPGGNQRPISETAYLSFLRMRSRLIHPFSETSPLHGPAR